jgi:phage terminase large subunit GpA-like protein
VREWVKLRERNEALDLEVYALAALYILGPALIRRLPERAARLTVPVGARLPNEEEAPKQIPSVSARLRRLRPGGGWVNGWRG